MSRSSDDGNDGQTPGNRNIGNQTAQSPEQRFLDLWERQLSEAALYGDYSSQLLNRKLSE